MEVLNGVEDFAQNYDIYLSFPNGSNAEVNNGDDPSALENELPDFPPQDDGDDDEDSSDEEFTIFNEGHLRPVTPGSKISEIMLVLLYIR
jgi:hypothetical protein